MKLSISILRDKLQLLKKILAQLKRACQNQVIYLSFDFNYELGEGSLKISNYYNTNKISMGSQYVNCLVSFDLLHFVEVQKLTISSKKINNFICIQLKDFQNFVNDFLNIPDDPQNLKLLLTKDLSHQRFIKMVSENDQITQTNKSQIENIIFDEVNFEEINNKIVSIMIPSRDLNKVFDIANKSNQHLRIHFQFQLRQPGQLGGHIIFSLQSPNVQVAYQINNVNYFRTDLIKESLEHTVLIQEKFCKQLHFVSSIDEKLCLAILENGSLVLEFSINEKGQDNSIITIVTQSFVIPYVEEYENQGEEGENLPQNQPVNMDVE